MLNERPTYRLKDAGRVLLFIFGLPVSAILALPLYERYSQSVDALAATAGVSATFAGFIVAILTLLGDASALLPGNWRVASAQSAEIHVRFRRLQFIFFCYLILCFSAIFLLITQNDFTPPRVYIAYASCSLLWYCLIVTFEMPKSLNSIRADRAKALMANRREEEKKNTQPVPLPEGD